MKTLLKLEATLFDETTRQADRCASAAVKSGDGDAIEEMLDTLIKFVKE